MGESTRFFFYSLLFLIYELKILYNMLINELIEKAFCDGYEYAQREFGKGSIRHLKKVAKNAIKGEHIFQNSGMDAVKSTSAYRSLNRSIPGGVRNTGSTIERNASNLIRKAPKIK